MGRRAVLGAVAAGACFLLATVMTLDSGRAGRPGPLVVTLGSEGGADRPGSPSTTAGAGAAVKPSSPTSPRGVAVSQVLPPGTEVRGAQLVKTGAADYELFTADGPGGTYEVTLYNRFEPAELDDMGLARKDVPGGVVWVEEGGSDATSVYFLSSEGIGLSVANRSATGPAAPVDSLEGMARRLAPLVARIRR